MTGVVRPTRLLHVISTLDAGGSETWAMRLISGWRGRLDQSVVAISRASSVLEANIMALAPLRVVSDDHPDGVGASAIFRSVRQAALEFRPDAILIHTFGVHQVMAALAARSVGVRHLAASAGNPPPEDRRSRIRWAALLLASRLVGCPIAGCSHAVDLALRRLGVGLPSRSFPIAPGIATDGEYAVRVQRREKTELGMVSRLDEIKDHDTLLRAFALVTARVPAARLTIIGDGPLRLALTALAQQLGVGDAVTFLGRRTDVPALLDQLDLFVFSTTRSEGFGIVLIEAMAKGLPIVASDVAACSEVLDRGTAGILVPAGDPIAMAAAIVQLMLDPDFAAELAARGRARVEAEYSAEICAMRWLSLLGIGDKVATTT